MPTLTRRLYARGGFEELEANQLQVLLAVDEAPSCSVSDIGYRLELGQGTVSVAVGILQQRSLITVAKDPADARRLALTTTSAGLQLLDRFLERAASVVKA